MEIIKLEELRKRIHPDLRNLIICKKDITAPQNIKRYGVEFVLSEEEPSSLPDEFGVEPVDDYDTVIPLMGYSFTFDELNPEQKYLYIQFLCNPYSGEISSEYAYLFYRGLERLIFTGDSHKAFDVILKLRNVYNEGSTFRNYSARMLLYMSALISNKKLFERTVETIDFTESIKSINKYYMFAKYKLNIHFDEKDFMMLASKFGFTNKLYINKYPQIFEECLKNIISRKTKKCYVPISKCIYQNEHKNSITHVFSVFANSSIACAEISTEVSSEGKKIVSALLLEAHNMVKIKILELKKAGQMSEVNNPPKRKAIPKPAVSEKAFEKMEQELMTAFEKSISAEEKYKKCCDLCNHYFTYRKENKPYYEKCLEYCKICLDLIPNILQEYSRKKEQEYLDLKEKKNRYIKSNDYFMLNIVQNSIDRLEEKFDFSKKVDAFVYMVTIFSEQGKPSESIFACDRALEYYMETEPKSRIGIMSKSLQIEYFKKERAKIEEQK